MGKIMTILLMVIESIFLMGAFILNYFTAKKMGVIRYIVNKNSRWEKDYPIQLIKYVFLAILLIFILMTVVKMAKGKSKGLGILSMGIFICFVLFVLTQSTLTVKAYYFVVLILMAAAFIQFLNTTLYWFREKK